MLSTIEAVHFAKPIIGVPMFFDQELNMKMAESRGYGISMPYRELTAEQFQNAVKNMFANPRFEV